MNDCLKGADVVGVETVMNPALDVMTNISGKQSEDDQVHFIFKIRYNYSKQLSLINLIYDAPCSRSVVTCVRVVVYKAKQLSHLAVGVIKHS